MRKSNEVFDVIKAIRECSEDGNTVNNPFLHFNVGDDVSEVWQWLQDKVKSAAVDELLSGKIPVFMVESGPVKDALDYINSVFDVPVIVHYSTEVFWDFQNMNTGESFDFEGYDIDQGTLEDAADSVDWTGAYYF